MWDALWAIPVILLILLVVRIFWYVSTAWISTIATIIGLILSIFISHPGHLAAGIFMGFFYGSAAVGFLYSMEKSFKAYRTN